MFTPPFVFFPFGLFFVVVTQIELINCWRIPILLKCIGYILQCAINMGIYVLTTHLLIWFFLFFLFGYTQFCYVEQSISSLKLLSNSLYAWQLAQFHWTLRETNVYDENFFTFILCITWIDFNFICLYAVEVACSNCNTQHFMHIIHESKSYFFFMRVWTRMQNKNVCIERKLRSRN